MTSVCRAGRRGRRRRRHHRRLDGVVPAAVGRRRRGAASSATPSARARARGRPGWCGRRAAPRPPSGSGCSAATSTSASTTCSASTPGSSSRATSCRASPRPRSTQAHERIAMQQSVGLDVRWVDADEVDAMNPAMAPGQTLGASYAAGDGYIDPPRNVLAYTAALFTAGVHVCERTAFTGLVVEGGRVTGVRTSAGDLATSRVVLTGGPTLAAWAPRPGVRIPSGGARHQVVVTEAHPDFAPERLPMVFDVASGIYWRPVRGRRDVGDEQPRGAAGRGDRVRRRLLRADARADRRCCCRPPPRSGCAGPGPRPSTTPPTTCRSSARRSAPTGPIEGTVVAAAGGHGMMWGPGVSRAAADLVLDGPHRRRRRHRPRARPLRRRRAAAASTPTPSPSPSPRSPDPPSPTRRCNAPLSAVEGRRGAQGR